MIKKCDICGVHFEEKDLRGGICDECFDGHDCRGDSCEVCIKINEGKEVINESVEFIKRVNNYGYGSEGSPLEYK